MGRVAKSITKPFKSVAKTVSKVVKKTAQAIKKVGKSVMKGVAKISNKLGPLGMIALSIAMPYALAGLSSFTTAAMASNNVFLQAVGQVGNVIRTGYQAFNAGISKGFSSITNSISTAFKKFAPQAVQDSFSAISEGAKNLYQKAVENVSKITDPIKQAMPKPFTAQEGTVQFFDEDGIQLLKSSDAGSLIQQGKITGGDLGQQTLSGKSGWFTKANKIGIEGDSIVQQTINDAYKSRLDSFGPNATRMFEDVKNYSKDIGTYINDEQIGSLIENNAATIKTSYKIPDVDIDMTGRGAYKNTYEIQDLTQTKNYTALNEEGTELLFNGNETFKSPPVKNALAEANKKAMSKAKDAAIGYASSLLKPTTPTTQPTVPYYAGATSDSGFIGTGYGGTDIKGTAGGNLVAQVFGENAANRISNYYRNMNILSSVG